MQNLHQKISDTVREYRKQEAHLIDLVLEADFSKSFLEMGYSSLFEYLNFGQGLSAATVSNLITVARKSVTIPEMREAIASGEVGLAKLRMVSAVINPNNKTEWIAKSKTLSCRELEKEVAQISPYKPRRDFWHRINAEYFRLSIDTTEDFKALAARAQDVFSKKCQSSKTLAEVFQWALKEALTRHDPLLQVGKSDSIGYSVTRENEPGNSSVTANQRQPIPRGIRNQVNLRDHGRCTFQSNGRRCNHRRFLHIHHKKAVKDGGQNTVENLMTLCEMEEMERSLPLIRRLPAG